MQSSRVTTSYYRELLPKDLCLEYYETLRDTIRWEEGVQSKQGFTRLAKSLSYGEHPLIDEIIQLAVNLLSLDIQYW